MNFDQITEIVNCTKHPLNIVKKDGSVWTIPPSGMEARVAQVEETVGTIQGCQVVRKRFLTDQIEDLPDPQAGTAYAVSSLVASALEGVRDDLVCPGSLQRDEEGRIVGAVGFSII